MGPLNLLRSSVTVLAPVVPNPIPLLPRTSPPRLKVSLVLVVSKAESAKHCPVMNANLSRIASPHQLITRLRRLGGLPTPILNINPLLLTTLHTRRTAIAVHASPTTTVTEPTLPCPRWLL